QIGALADVAEQTLGIPEYAAFQLPISILFAAASTSGGNALVLDIAGGYWDKLALTPAHPGRRVPGRHRRPHGRRPPGRPGRGRPGP
ncbi:MAG TPA: hypothetical protein VJ849_16090, partial [Actinomycetes bacterium]|nr:hypothetical protein [Actinomycetes bacterium]